MMTNPIAQLRRLYERKARRMGADKPTRRAVFKLTKIVYSGACL
jgi:hypothetical protein